MTELINMILLRGRVQIVEGDNELERAGASVTNGFIAVTQGAAELVEAGVDGIYCATTWLASQVPVNDIEARKYMQDNTMTFVATEHVDNAYKDFYENNFIGQELDKRAYDPLKSTGVGYQLIKGVAYEGTMATIAAATGGGAVALAGIAGVTGYGRNSQEYWANARDNAEGDEWLTEKVFNEGNAYGAANGLWEAATHYVGGEMLVSQVPVIAESAVATATTRVVIDAGMNALDTPVKAAIDSAVTGEDFMTAFEERGGWGQMGVDALIGGVTSSIAEVINWDNTKMAAETVQDVKLLKENGMLDNFSDKDQKRLAEALNRNKQKGKSIDVSEFTERDVQRLVNQTKTIEYIQNIKDFNNYSKEDQKYILDHAVEISNRWDNTDIDSVISMIFPEGDVVAQFSSWVAVEKENELKELLLKEPVATVKKFFEENKNMQGDEYYTDEALDRIMREHIYIHKDLEDLRQSIGDSNTRAIAYNRGGEIHLLPKSGSDTIIHETFHSLGGFRDDTISWRGINEATTEYLTNIAEGKKITSMVAYGDSVVALDKITQQLNRIDDEITAEQLLLDAYISDGSDEKIKNLVDSIYHNYTGYSDSLFSEINDNMCVSNGFRADGLADNNPIARLNAAIELKRDTALFERAVDKFINDYLS